MHPHNAHIANTNTQPQEAANQLAAAQQSEDALLAAMQSPGGGAAHGPFAPPQPPRLLQRGPSFVELTHFALTGRGLVPPAAWAVYCKPAGAGVALSINRTAMECPGGRLHMLTVACKCLLPALDSSIYWHLAPGKGGQRSVLMHI